MIVNEGDVFWAGSAITHHGVTHTHTHTHTPSDGVHMSDMKNNEKKILVTFQSRTEIWNNVIQRVPNRYISRTYNNSGPNV